MARRRASAAKPVVSAPRANVLRDERAPNTLGGVSSAQDGATSRALASTGSSYGRTSAASSRSVMAPSGGSRQPATTARATNRQNGAARTVTGLRLPWWLLLVIAIVVYLVALNVLGAPQ